MSLFKKIYWWFRGWKASLKIGAEIMREGLERDWDENQTEDMYKHRMRQWAIAHLPAELQ
jgi:hypothetical protein